MTIRHSLKYRKTTLETESGTCGKYMKVWREVGWVRTIDWNEEYMAVKQINWPVESRNQL